MYCPPPVIRCGSSRRWILAPIIWLIAIPLCPPTDRHGRRHRHACRLHGLDDVRVASAAAQIALEALANFGFGRMRIAVQQGSRGHNEPWRAESALQTVLVPEGVLQRVQRAVLRQAFDGGQLTP